MALLKWLLGAEALGCNASMGKFFHLVNLLIILFFFVTTDYLDYQKLHMALESIKEF